MRNNYKFEQLKVWQMALEYVDLMYEVINSLPAREQIVLGDQLKRAASSVALNFAKGSTGLGDKEQMRFLNIFNRNSCSSQNH